MKIHLKSWALAFGAAISIGCLTPVQGQEVTAEENYIQVTGRAEREVTPDEFQVAITIQERDSKGKISIEEQQRSLTAALKRVGIDPEKALRLSANASSYHKKGNSLSSARYDLTLHSMAELQAAFEALEPLNLSQVVLRRATYSQMEQLEEELRREAILNARQCARQLAEALGQEVGRCLQIIDWNNELSAGIYLDNALFRAKGAVTEEAAIVEELLPEFRSLKLNYQLQARFLLP